jgi:hypothetical protein
MNGKHFAYILLIAIFLCNCVNKKVAEDEDVPINIKNNGVKLNIEPSSGGNTYANLRIMQEELDKADISKPYSLREISQRITEDEINRVYYIYILNGENINSLDGIELFPSLQYLSIHNSPMKILQGIPEGNNSLQRLALVGNVLEDVSNIVLFKNLNTLILRSSDRLRHFDISNMENLEYLLIQESTGIDFSSLRLPENLKSINFFGCNIGSLRDVAMLFDYCEVLILDCNPIHEIERDLNFGRVKLISLVGCPVADKYFDRSNPNEESYIKINGVTFNFYDDPS